MLFKHDYHSFLGALPFEIHATVGSVVTVVVTNPEWWSVLQASRVTNGSPAVTQPMT